MKKKKIFLRQDAHKVKRLKNKWRRPKGMHNKMRRGVKGHRRSPSIGYRKRRSERGYINGLKTVMIRNFNDINKLDKSCAVIISSRLGLRKKIQIINGLKQRNIRAINIDVDKFLKSIEEKKKKEESKTQVKEEKSLSAEPSGKTGVSGKEEPSGKETPEKKKKEAAKKERATKK